MCFLNPSCFCVVLCAVWLSTYEPAVDIAELVSLETVMEQEELGPNGGTVLCGGLLCCCVVPSLLVYWAHA